MNLVTNKDDIVAAIADGARNRRVYLWMQPDTPDDYAVLGKLPFTAIWSERGDFGFLKNLQNNLTGDNPGTSKQLIRIPTVIGSDFSFQTLLPIVFTRGENFSYKDLDSLNLSRGQRVQRDRQLDEASNMVTAGVVLIAGGNDLDLWKQALTEELLNPDDPVFPDIEAVKVILLGMPDNDECRDALKTVLSGRRTPLFLFPGSPSDLVSMFEESFQKDSLEDGRHRIRIKIKNNFKSVTIDDLLEKASKPIDEDYYLITEDDFKEPEGSNLTTIFRDFISSTTPVWQAFQAGFPFQRHYKPESESDKTLYDLTVNLLEKSAAGKSNCTITLPADPGSGSTTLIRQVAFQIARDNGFPVLLAKPSLDEIDYWQITHFLTEFWRKASDDASKFAESSVLLVYDEEQMTVEDIKWLARELEKDGRHVVILRVVASTGKDKEVYYALGQNTVCETLQNDVSEIEASALYQHLRETMKPINENMMPDSNAWKQYRRATNNHDDKAYFWVCLHYFILGRLNNFTGNGIKDIITQNIGEAFDDLYKQNEKYAKMVAFLAISSCFCIAIPFMLLKKLTDLDIRSILDAEKIIEDKLRYITTKWAGGTQDDYQLSLNHSLFAKVIIDFLADDDSFSEEKRENLFGYEEKPTENSYPVEWLKPILENLDHESLIHIKYGEKIATSILKYEPRTFPFSYTVVDSMLDAFSYYPSTIIQGSATILQARAITSSKSRIILKNRLRNQNNEIDQLNVEKIKNRFRQAEADMKTALSLVASYEDESTEDPRILKTTLANIYEAWSRFAREIGDAEEFDNKAMAAAELYQSVLVQWPDNAHARYGYAKLLLTQLPEDTEPAAEDVENLEQALVALDIEPDPSFHDEWEKLRSRILACIDSDRYQEHINSLVRQGYEIGYIIKARYILHNTSESALTDEQLEKAIKLLEQAQNAGHKASRPESRPFCLYQCLSRHSRYRWNFYRRYELLFHLESTGFNMSVSLLYQYAVLCYQVNREEDGNRQFGLLRKGQRHHDLQIDEFEYWMELPVSESDEPPQIRTTNMRVTSVDEYGGWARVEGLTRAIPFSQRHPWGRTIKKGTKIACHVRFYKAGPRAIPVQMAKEQEVE